MIGKETILHTKKDSYEFIDAADVKELMAVWMKEMNSGIFGRNIAADNISFVSIDPRNDIYGSDGLFEPLPGEDAPRLFAVVDTPDMKGVRFPMDFVCKAVAEAKTVISLVKAETIENNKAAAPRVVKASDVNVDMSADNFFGQPNSPNTPRAKLTFNGVYIWIPRPAP